MKVNFTLNSVKWRIYCKVCQYSFIFINVQLIFHYLKFNNIKRVYFLLKNKIFIHLFSNIWMTVPLKYCEEKRIFKYIINKIHYKIVQEIINTALNWLWVSNSRCIYIWIGCFSGWSSGNLADLFLVYIIWYTFVGINTKTMPWWMRSFHNILNALQSVSR